MNPELTQHPLARADGSATFSSKVYAVLAAVNGPVEVQRRDELPEEAAIEVNVRPTSGVGGPRERWLERVIVSLLRSLLLVHMHPRTLIQVTLQVTKEPTLKMKRIIKDVALIPVLANASFLALVDGALPLERTMTAGLAVVRDDGGVVVDPDEKDLFACKNIHAIAYSSEGDMLLNECAGEFRMEHLREVARTLKEEAMSATVRTGEDEAMVNGAKETEPWLRHALEENVQRSGAWREAG